MAARGIRNNNPGNIRWVRNNYWLGKVEECERQDAEFEEFIGPIYGLRALIKLLRNYRRKYRDHTIHAIITRWAPPNENNTEAYALSVARKTGIDRHAPLPDDDETMIAIAKAIVQHENGTDPYHPSSYIQAAKMA